MNTKKHSRVVFISQWRSLDATQAEGKDATSRGIPAQLEKWLNSMKDSKEKVFSKWLDGEQTDDTIIYDVLTDLEAEPKGLYKLDFEPAANEMVLVTRKQALSKTVGDVLSVRCRLPPVNNMHPLSKRMRTSNEG